MSAPRPPEACETMAELRLEIDAIDATLIALLARRAGYIDRAAQLKVREGLPPRTTARVAEVIDRVRHLAQTTGLDPELVETFWSNLIEWGIAREVEVMGVAEDETPS
jgi:isochorismate pyruvate lyase